MIPKIGDRFSDRIMRKTVCMICMMREDVRRLSDRIMRKMKRMIPNKVALQTRKA
jgi:hypothetical protein